MIMNRMMKSPGPGWGAERRDQLGPSERRLHRYVDPRGRKSTARVKRRDDGLRASMLCASSACRRSGQAPHQALTDRRAASASLRIESHLASSLAGEELAEQLGFAIAARGDGDD